MGDGARGGRLIEQGASIDESLKAAALEKTGDNVGSARLAPVVVDGHDVRMLERGNGLSLLLKSPDKVAIRSDLLVKDLDSDIAADIRLDCSVDRPDRAIIELLEKSIAAEGLTTQLERWVLLKDPLLKANEFRRWIDAELVGDQSPCPLIGAQRIALPTVPVVGEHELRPQVFTQ